MPGELQVAFHNFERAGNYERALQIADRIVREALSAEVREQFRAARDSLREYLRRHPYTGPTDDPRRLRRRNREPDAMSRFPMEPMAREPIVNVRTVNNGICECPPRNIGYLKKAPIQIRDLMAERTTNMITRYQSLVTQDVVSNPNALTHRLNCISDATPTLQEIAMPFYMFKLGCLPQLFDRQTSANPADIAIRPKVCYRLYCRSLPYDSVTNVNGYSYSDNPSIPVKPMFYFKAYDASTAQNNADLVTNANRNDYKFEWTTGAVTSVPKIKKLYHMWSEVQWLMQDSKEASNSLDHTTIHTGFIKFPSHMEPDHYAYASNYLTENVQKNNIMSPEEAVAIDSFWTRYFNKDMSHPLMRSGLANKSSGPYMHHVRQHCLETSTMRGIDTGEDRNMIKAVDRYNFNRKITYSADEEIAFSVPEQVIGSFYQAKYLQVTGSNGYGGWPEFGQSEFAFITSARYGSPEAFESDANPSFDIMIRNRLTYASPF